MPRATKSAVHPTSVGQRLRILREKQGKTQVDVEVEAQLGEHYLKRIELGQIGKPQRLTIEKILTALSVTYNERKEILELYGYAVSTPLPTAQDIDWAKAVCQEQMRKIIFPVQLMDCAQRVLAWNNPWARTIGFSPNDPELDRLSAKTVLQIAFDEKLRVNKLFKNPSAYFHHMLPVLKSELRPYFKEDWCKSLIAEAIERIPHFKEYWHSIDEKELREIAGRPLISLSFQTPKVGVLSFWPSSEPFINDSRFRLLYYVPADIFTMQRCITWRDEHEL